MFEQEKQTERKILWSTVLLVCLIFVVVYFVSIGFLIYFSPALTGRIDQNRMVRGTINVVPYPVAMVGTKFVTSEKLLANLASVQRFYENQDFSKLGLRVDFSTVDGKKRLEIKGKEVLQKLVEDTIIQEEAKKDGLTLNQDVIDQEVDRMLKEYGTGDALKNNLQKLYGWNLEDFKENIVKPDLYREEISAYIQKNDPSFALAKDKITAAASDLQGGMSFSDAVKKYSDGESVADDGSLGWFSADQMLPEVAAVVFKLDSGEQSEIIQSSLGYHIVRVEDKKTENKVDMVKVSQIFVRTKSFSAWLSENEKKYNILVFSREFQWNNKSQELEFRSVDLQNYEKDMQNNPPNDPSVIF